MAKTTLDKALTIYQKVVAGALAIQEMRAMVPDLLRELTDDRSLREVSRVTGINLALLSRARRGRENLSPKMFGLIVKTYGTNAS